MFLRHKICRKDGKEHRAWSVVENRRVQGGGVVQRQVLYLGEINDSERAGCRTNCGDVQRFPQGGRSVSDDGVNPKWRNYSEDLEKWQANKGADPSDPSANS